MEPRASRTLTQSLRRGSRSRLPAGPLRLLANRRPRERGLPLRLPGIANPARAGWSPKSSRMTAHQSPAVETSVATHCTGRTSRGVVYWRSLQFPLLANCCPRERRLPWHRRQPDLPAGGRRGQAASKIRGEASAAACAFWRASTQRSILVLAGSIPQRYLRPRAATEAQPRRPSSHSPAAVLWWPPSREPVATSAESIQS